MTASDAIFSEIIGEQLGAVTFVQDYLQLHFDGPTINVYMPMRVHVSDRVVERKEDGFRNALCAQIAKIVKSVSYQAEETLWIAFEDDSMISISLRSSEYSSPEAIATHGFKGGDFWV